MSINAVRNVRSKAVPHHPFPVRFPDAIALAQPAEGVAGSSLDLISSCGR